MPTPEHRRLAEIRDDIGSWRRWGPYLSDRSWGTVREDYSADGNAWDYLPHDLARSKAYRWGEDGIAGICDRYQLLVLRAGLLERPRPDPQGTALRPDHQRGQPRRGRQGILFPPRQHADALLHEVPLQVSAGASFPMATGRGKPPPQRPRAWNSSCSTPASSTRTATSTSSSNTPRPTPKISCIRIEAFNRGPEPAPLHLLPHLWFRNTWALGRRPPGRSRPSGRSAPAAATVVPGRRRLRAASRPATCRCDYRLGLRHLYGPAGGSCCSPTTKPTRPAFSAPAEQPQAVRQGCLSSLDRSTASTASTRTTSAPRRPALRLSALSSPAARRWSGCG